MQIVIVTEVPMNGIEIKEVKYNPKSKTAYLYPGKDRVGDHVLLIDLAQIKEVTMTCESKNTLVLLYPGLAVIEDTIQKLQDIKAKLKEGKRR